MRIRDIVENLVLPIGLEALLLGKEVITNDGCSLGKVRKVKVEPAQDKLQVWIEGISDELKEFHFSDIQSLNRKTVVLRDGVCQVN